MTIFLRDKTKIDYHPLLIETIALFYRVSFIANSMHLSPNLELSKHRKDLLFSVWPENKK